MKTFDDYISEIDFPHFLKTQGYVLDKNKSAKNPQYGWLTFDLKGQSGTTAETILVKIADDKNPKFKGQFFYYNPNDSRDKGNIIHFIASRNGWHLKENAKEINKFLQNYTGNTPPIPNRPITADISKEERNKAVASFYELTPLSDRSYLISRGISNEVIDSELFKGKVCHNIITKTEGEKSYTFLNTVFPMVTEARELVGLEIKNKNFHGNAPESQKSNSLWFSNVQEGKPIDRVFIGESGVDCISHYQLRQEDFINKNILYLSTGGNLAEGQIEMIDRLNQKYRPIEGITLINDNDPAGIKNNIKIMGKITSLHGNNNIKFDLSKQGEYNFQLTVKVTGEIEKIRSSLDTIDSSFNKYNSSEENRFTILSKGIINQEGTIQIEIPNNVSNFKIAEKILIKGKVLDKDFTIDRPANKDFNDDLREKLNIKFESKSKEKAKEDNNLKNKNELGFN